LLDGSNLIAAEIHQQAASSSDMSFDLELIGVPLPTLYSVRFGNALVFYWSDPAYHLVASDTLPGSWQPIPGASPVAVPITAAQKFFRLRNP
jgi:hypothetical protein